MCGRVTRIIITEDGLNAPRCQQHTLALFENRGEETVAFLIAGQGAELAVAVKQAGG